MQLGVASVGNPPAVAHRAVRNAAVRALVGELVTYPKPGLVSLMDNGSHLDMDATTFMRSSFALRHYFLHAVEAGAEGAPFAQLARLGRAAETRMLRATAGVNTHRGAIFNLGLLAAAAGSRATREQATLGEVVSDRWGADIAAHQRQPDSHGSRVARVYGAGGAQIEAAEGFPSVYRIALPALRGVLHRGGGTPAARVQAFFSLMSRLVDTNLLHRGGESGLGFAQAAARGFLDAGGVRRTDWKVHAERVHHQLVARRLSPGGSADLLAACLFVAVVDPAC